MQAIPPEVSTAVQTILTPVNTAMMIWLIYASGDLRRRVDRLEKFFFSEGRAGKIIRRRKTDRKEA